MLIALLWTLALVFNEKLCEATVLMAVQHVISPSCGRQSERRDNVSIVIMTVRERWPPVVRMGETDPHEISRAVHESNSSRSHEMKHFTANSPTWCFIVTVIIEEIFSIRYRQRALHCRFCSLGSQQKRRSQKHSNQLEKLFLNRLHPLRVIVWFAVERMVISYGRFSRGRLYQTSI